MNHDPALGEPEELAALYLAGAMTPDEHRAFEAHLGSGCAACEAEFRRLVAAVGVLARGIEPVAPDPTAHGRLVESIAGLPPAPGAGPEPRRAPPRTGREPTTRRAARAKWRPAGVEGVEVRMLSTDTERDRVTALVRMAPGGKLPAHIHQGQEEIFIVEGDLRTDDDALLAGDYQLSPPGTRHAEATSINGCTALIIMPLSSIGDFLVKKA